MASRHDFESGERFLLLLVSQFFREKVGVCAREQPGYGRSWIHGLSQSARQSLDRIRGCETIANGHLAFSRKRWRSRSTAPNYERARCSERGNARSAAGERPDRRSLVRLAWGRWLRSDLRTCGRCYWCDSGGWLWSWWYRTLTNNRLNRREGLLIRSQAFIDGRRLSACWRDCFKLRSATLLAI